MFACLYGIVVTCCYVGFLYLIPGNIRKLPRDDLVHIQWRMGTIVVTTAVLFAVTYAIIHSQGFEIPADNFLIAVGLQFDTINAVLIIITTALLMVAFYLGA